VDGPGISPTFEGCYHGPQVWAEKRGVSQTMKQSAVGAQVADHFGWFNRLKRWAKRLKRDVHALWLAARDPRTPWHAKALALLVAAYALSPIDLIPDFIPVVGYLDDLIIAPAGIMLVVWLIPPPLMEEFRATASEAQSRPRSKLAASVFITIWISCAGLLIYALAR
jgi:uncharacterized membrane protein YkvA (DUF1232 family)